MANGSGFFPRMPAALMVGWKTLGEAVGLFFVISGFVIPASLFRHRSLTRFFIDRVLRIMPLFVTLHLLVFSIGPFVGYKWLHGIDFFHYTLLFFTNLTFTALPLGLPLVQRNSWTLTYEWAFYFCVAAAWVIVGRTQRRRSALALIGLLAIGLCIIFPACWPFLLGLAFARFLPSLYMSRRLEIVAVPISLVLYFYVAQYVSILASMAFAAVLFRAALQDGTYTSRFLCTRPMQFLGMISYSIYLVHPLVMFAGEMIGHKFVHWGVSVPVTFIIFMIYTISVVPIMSFISYELVEVRLKKLLRVRLT
ncbi:Acyltransferase [Acidisarcina polymorpha]|uniref:Acyltransferase n=2 Tax=Acidisarcina polymorpha TaxID=2211140 RepID=A0A2Z5G0V2_9BACT|nr:Acyltransferase [Acidisarcina polymorpha]